MLKASSPDFERELAEYPLSHRVIESSQSSSHLTAGFSQRFSPIFFVSRGWMERLYLRIWRSSRWESVTGTVDSAVAIHGFQWISWDDYVNGLVLLGKSEPVLP